MSFQNSIVDVEIELKNSIEEQEFLLATIKNRFEQACETGTPSASLSNHTEFNKSFAIIEELWDYQRILISLIEREHEQLIPNYSEIKEKKENDNFESPNLRSFVIENENFKIKNFKFQKNTLNHMMKNPDSADRIIEILHSQQNEMYEIQEIAIKEFKKDISNILMKYQAIQHRSSIQLNIQKQIKKQYNINMSAFKQTNDYSRRKYKVEFLNEKEIEEKINKYNSSDIKFEKMLNEQIQLGRSIKKYLPLNWHTYKKVPEELITWFRNQKSKRQQFLKTLQLSSMKKSSKVQLAHKEHNKRKLENDPIENTDKDHLKKKNKKMSVSDIISMNKKMSVSDIISKNKKMSVSDIISKNKKMSVSDIISKNKKMSVRDIISKNKKIPVSDVLSKKKKMSDDEIIAYNKLKYEFYLSIKNIIKANTNDIRKKKDTDDNVIENENSTNNNTIIKNPTKIQVDNNENIYFYQIKTIY
ncbi:hypothetical protein U3516DRAFT_813443 [Neocallimastix sp. 'constans']